MLQTTKIDEDLENARRELKNSKLVRIPSPATSFVALATDLTSEAPTFFSLSLNSILLATVTPSLVTLGDP